MGTVTVLSTALFIATHEPLSHIPYLLMVAALNSLSFTLATLTHMEALKRVQASVVYPMIRLNALIVVIFSVLFFKDRLSIYQVGGIIIGLAVMAMFAKEASHEKETPDSTKRGLSLILLSMVFGAVAVVSSKFAAMHTQKLAFMALSYFLGTLLSFAFRNRLATEKTGEKKKDAFMIGVVMGLLNFAGFYMFLAALSKGPLSIIGSIMGLHFMIAVILSTIIYSEKLTPRRIMGILLTLISVVLLRR
jgi:drug/metabolite transporter (DMT)-like permease